MIEAFATTGANHPLDIGSLPRRARCRQDFQGIEKNGKESLVLPYYLSNLFSFSG
jgi:hypothetical protein